MKEVSSVILCHRWCAQPVNSTRANTEQQTQLIFMSACWVPGEGGILSLSIAQRDCANGSHGCTHTPAIKTQGQFGNCLCAGHGTHKGTIESLQSTSGSLRARRGLHMYLHRQFIWFLLEVILHSLSFPMNLPYKRQEKVCETVTSHHTGHPEVMPCQHHTHIL